MCDGNCCNQKDIQFLVLCKDSHKNFGVHSLCESKYKAMGIASELVNSRLADRVCVMRVLPKVSVCDRVVSWDTEHINELLKGFKV